MAEAVILYVRGGDPACTAAQQYLQQRGIDYTVRDVVNDPSVSAVLFGRLGKVVVPTFQIGDRLLVGFDPVQLARFLPRPGADDERVSFGAAVRAVTAEIAATAGLAAAFGVELGVVKAESPAAVAGLEPGDLISEIGAYTLTGGAEQFGAAVAARRPGDAMNLTIWRGGQSRPVEVRFPVPERTDGDTTVSAEDDSPVL